jgi:hypothetical protein
MCSICSTLNGTKIRADLLIPWHEKYFFLVNILKNKCSPSKAISMVIVFPFLLQGVNQLCISQQPYFLNTLWEKRTMFCNWACNLIFELQWLFVTHCIFIPLSVIKQVAWIAKDATHHIYFTRFWVNFVTHFDTPLTWRYTSTNPFGSGITM